MESSEVVHKSENIKQLALANGWKAEVVPDLSEYDISGRYSDVIYRLYAIRGNEDDLVQETIKVVWQGDLQIDCLYVYGKYSQKPARKAGVIKLLTGKPQFDQKRMKKAKPQDFEPDGPEDIGVPWEPDSPAIDIMLAVIQAEITWVSHLSGTDKSARVDVNLKEPGSARNFRVYDAPSGRRILEWADSLGFHCVAVEDIIRVVK